MICDEAGGCGEQPVFPPSMSDFKPGESKISEAQTVIGVAMPEVCTFAFLDFPVNRKKLIGFFNAG